MKLLTLKISQEYDVLLYSIISLDPSVKIDQPTFTSDKIDNLYEELNKVSQSFIAAIEQNDRGKLIQLGKEYFSKLIPKPLQNILENAAEEYLYLDLAENLIGFTWELMTLASGTILQDKFIIGRHLRIAHKENKNTDILSGFSIIADPSGDLPSSAEEGADLKREVSKLANTTYLSGNITKDEAVSHFSQGIAALHFAGHTTSDEIMMNGGNIGLTDLDEIQTPYFVFLNSCGAADPNGWQNGTSNLAKALINKGTYHLIANYTRIESDRAKKFSMAFYSRFLVGDDIGSSLNYARSQFDETDLARYNYCFYGNPLFVISKRKVAIGNKITLMALVSLVILAAILLTLFKNNIKRNTADDISNLRNAILAYPSDLPSPAKEMTINGILNGPNIKGVPESQLERLRIYFAVLKGYKSRDDFDTYQSKVSQLGCGVGYAENCYKIAQSKYKKGNTPEAKKYYSLACQSKSKKREVFKACGHLGAIVKNDGQDSEAIRFWSKGCKGGYGVACRLLGDYTTDGQEKKKAFYQEACSKSDEEGCLKFAVLEYPNGDKALSKKLLRMECYERKPRGCFQLAKIHLKENNRSEAHKFASLAVRYGLKISAIENDPAFKKAKNLLNAIKSRQRR